MCTCSLRENQWNLQKEPACMTMRPVIKVLFWTIFSLHHFKKILHSRCCKGWSVEVGNCSFVFGSWNWWLCVCTNKSQHLPNLARIAHHHKSYFYKKINSGFHLLEKVCTKLVAHEWTALYHTISINSTCHVSQAQCQTGPSSHHLSVTSPTMA